MPVLTSVLAPPAPGPVDLLFHTADRTASHQEAVPNVGVVLHLTGDTPDLTPLRERTGRRLHLLPCLTHRLTTGESPPGWAPYEPDLVQHISEHRVAQGADQLDDTVRELLHRPLPSGAPAWHLYLLSGHAPRKYCIVLISHHEVLDAANLVTVAETLLAPDDNSRATSVAAFEAGPVPVPGPRQLLDTTARLWRNTRPHGLWNDPDQPLSGRRHVLWQEVPTGLLEKTGRAYGASTSDVFLAALTHAVDRWAAEHRTTARRDELPVMVPVNIRTPAETGLPGNRFFLARVDLPAGPMTPMRRLSRTPSVTAPLKDPVYRQTVHSMSRCRPEEYAQLIARTAVPDGLSVVGSSFRIRKRFAYRGDPVDRVVPVICCPDGFPLAVGLFLYGDTSTASFQIDRALPGAESVPRLWRRALDDMANCAPGGDDR